MKQMKFFMATALLLLQASLVKADCPDLTARKLVASSFHSTVLVDYTGLVRYWGDASSASSAGADVLSPVTLPGYTGTPVAVAAGSTKYTQHALYLLTTTKLYGWGYSNKTIKGGTTGNVTLSEIPLPAGITIDSINFIEASSGGLAIITKYTAGSGGNVYIRQGAGASGVTNLLYGDNSSAIDTAWHKVKTNATTALSGVVRFSYATRGCMALTSAGAVYVWGSAVYIGGGTAMTASAAFATSVTLPSWGAGVSAADVNIVTRFTYESGAANSNSASEFILGTNGKVYSLGEGFHGALGINSETDVTSWQTVQNAAGTSDLTNVVLIGTNSAYLESSAIQCYHSVGALTSDGYLYLWGDNSYSMIGGSTTNYLLPRIPPNFSINDARVSYFEMGGHTCIAFLRGSNKFCYVGHKVRGSMGDGTGDDVTRSTYDCMNTPPERICPPPTAAGCPVASGPDLIASANHATVIINNVPEVHYWGENSSSVDNGISLPSPVTLYEYSGTPISVAAGSVGTDAEASGTQMWVHTTSGLWGWGYSAQTINNTTPAAFLTKVALPVDTSVVKFIRASKGGVALVTKTGEVWVKAGSASNCSGLIYGTGVSTLDAAGTATWHQVTTAPSTPLTGVTDLSFSGTAAMAMTASGSLYVWGVKTLLGNGTAAADRSLATLASLPAGVVPADVEIVEANALDAAQFVLDRTGNVYAVGENQDGVLGQNTTTDATSWVKVKNAAGTGNLAGIRKLSSNNPYAYSSYAVGALTQAGVLYQWGKSDSSRIGGTVGSINMLPRIPAGLTTEAVADFEMGGHMTVAMRFSSNRYCFVGHKIGGDMGDGSTATATDTAYDCVTPPSTETMCYGNTYTIGGNLYDDGNGMTDNLVNGVGLGTLTSTQMYVNILDTMGYVLATTPVGAGGTYAFSNFFAGTYALSLSNAAGTVGALPATPAVPATWAITGEQNGTIASTGINAPADGKFLPFTISNAGLSNANFGAELRPTAGTATMSNQPYNPLGMQIPAAQFISADADGTADSIRISAMPSNANSITINGVTYTSAGGGGTTVFPAGGVTIPLSSGVPSYPVFVVPASAGVTVGVPFYSKDNAGFESASAGAVNIPFVNSGISIGGSVWDDADADGTKDAGESFTNAAGTGETLYAMLVQTNHTPAGVPQVVSSTAVAAGGSYSFSNVANGNDFEVRIVSKSSAPALGTTASTVTPNLAPNYIGVSVNSGGSSPATTTTSAQKLTITGLAVSASNMNFGIQQLPTATPDNFTISAPAGHAILPLTASSAMGPLRGSDPEDQPSAGSLSGKTAIINSVSGMNGNELYYNGSLVTDGTTITSYDPTKLTIKFEGIGSTSASFTFSYKDNGGATNTTPAAYSITWGSALPLNLLSFDAQTKATSVLITWRTADESDMQEYVVMRSADGNQWQQLGAVAPAGSGSYQYSDEHPLAGYAYYHLKMMDLSGAFVVSPTRKIYFGANAADLTLYPNPVTDQLNIYSPKGLIRLEVIDVSGKMVYQVSGNVPAILDTRSWPDGTYLIKAEQTDHSILQYRIGKVSK